MRTHVAKMLVSNVAGVVGTGAAVLAIGQLAVAPWADIQAYLTDAAPSGAFLPIPLVSDEFGFIKRVENGAEGKPRYITDGPFKSASALLDSNEHEVAIQGTAVLTVDTAVGMVDGKSYIVKVTYHDNLSIIPNQMKSTTVSVVYVSTMTDTTFADAIVAEFNKQDQLFVSVANTAGVITFTGLVLTTASKYNRIDRPEMVVFEVQVGDMTYGEYPTGIFAIEQGGVGTSVAAVLGQGSAAQVAWMEDQHQGRRGYSDRRMWNDSKQFVPTAVSPNVYDVLVTTDNKDVEGDMQNIRHNPIGNIAATVDNDALVTALGTITGNAVNVIDHPVDS